MRLVTPESKRAAATGIPGQKSPRCARHRPRASPRQGPNGGRSTPASCSAAHLGSRGWATATAHCTDMRLLWSCRLRGRQGSGVRTRFLIIRWSAMTRQLRPPHPSGSTTTHNTGRLSGCSGSWDATLRPIRRSRCWTTYRRRAARSGPSAFPGCIGSVFESGSTPEGAASLHRD
jgi:hypothetical protein